MSRQIVSWVARCMAGICVACMFSAGSEADDRSSSLGPGYVSVLVGESFPAGSEGTTGHGGTLSVIAGHEFSAHFLAEANLQGSIFETGVHGGTDYYQQVVTVDAVWQLRDRRQSLFTPFLLVGAGPLRNDYYPNSRDGVGAAAEAGFGVVSAPLSSYGLRLRMDARYVHDFREGGHAEPRVVAGIDIQLGRVEHQVDFAPARVEIREVVREVVREVPAPTPMLLKDSDGDGVDDEHDECPDTLHGMKVDARGCAVAGQVVVLSGINFYFNDARVMPGAQATLDRVSLALMNQPSLRVEVAGHTDSVGSEAANLALSQRRAESVRRYLLISGVNPGQLTARGYGKSQPLVTPERGPDDSARNRRVELRVLAP